MTSCLRLVSLLSLTLAAALAQHPMDRPHRGGNEMTWPTPEVCVMTGTASGAGTDSDVFVTITGDQGSAPRVQLDSSGDDFENGDWECYGYPKYHHGTPLSVKVYHNGKGSGSGWYLDYIVFKFEGASYKADFHQWFDGETVSKDFKAIIMADF